MLKTCDSGANLRQAQQRLNIHRGKKLGGIAKNKDQIVKHLDAGQEVNAKIWVRLLHLFSDLILYAF
jgi:hypothetical protein